MLALGSFIAGSGILIAGLLALLFRHPNAPRWTRPEIVPMLICVPVAAAIGVGLAYIAIGVSQLVKGTGDSLHLLVLAAVVIGLVLVWRVFGIRQRLKAYATATSGTSLGAYGAEPTLVIDETHPPPPGRS
jgi:heme A synthase